MIRVLDSAGSTLVEWGRQQQQQQQVLTELRNCPNWMFWLIKRLRIDSKEVEGGRCMRESDGRLCFNEKERGKVWKDYMEQVMHKEND